MIGTHNTTGRPSIVKFVDNPPSKMYRSQVDRKGLPLQYKTNAQVIQYSKTGVPIREYTFYGIFPTDIAAIQVDWGQTDTIEEFTVSFAYDWWEVTGGVTTQATWRSPSPDCPSRVPVLYIVTCIPHFRT